MRDIACDRFMNSSFDEIVSAETIDLRSTGHASDICSLLTAYRVLDVIYALEHPDALKAPVHQRLRVNFSSFKVLFEVFFRCAILTLGVVQVPKQIADWTSTAEKFRKSFNTRKNADSSSMTFTTFTSRQVYALYHLHTTIQNNKPLFNLQLAATHVAFMLDHESGGNVRER